jgi:hypothetical protein
VLRYTLRQGTSPFTFWTQDADTISSDRQLESRPRGGLRPARSHTASNGGDPGGHLDTDRNPRQHVARGGVSARSRIGCASARGERRTLGVHLDETSCSDFACGRDEKYSACAIITLSSGALLAVFGTVLPWRGSRWRGLPSANACAFDAALGVQSQDWRDLNADRSLAGLCVAGDFNQDLSATHYYWSRAARRSLRAALENNDLVALTAGDADPVRVQSNNAAACIDHICLSSAIASRTDEPHAWSPVIDGHRLSDHPGIQVDIFDC